MPYDPNYPNGYPYGYGGQPAPQGNPSVGPAPAPGPSPYPQQTPPPQPGYPYAQPAPAAQPTPIEGNSYVTTDVPDVEKMRIETRRRRVFFVILGIILIIIGFIVWEIVDLCLK